MSEDQSEYVTKEEVEDAMDMLGKGYPTLEIESPRTVTERRDGKLVEADKPAFVKIYTSFKTEMKDIDADALKVWLFIALSVNRFSGEAHPGLRCIADGVDMAVNTVRSAIERLDTKYNLLQVEKEEGKTNKYYPVDYVSANRETVSPDDTPPETVSNSGRTVSKKAGTVSTMSRKSAQPEEPDSTIKRGDLVDGILAFSQTPGIRRMVRIDSILSYLGEALRVNTETKRWKDFAKFVDDRQQIGEKVEVFVSWLKSQKNFDIQFWPPSKMTEMWPQAFTDDKPLSLEAQGWK